MNDDAERNDQTMPVKKTREQKRVERADAVCREVRYQLAQYGTLSDPSRVCDLIISWMKFAKKGYGKRPS